MGTTIKKKVVKKVTKKAIGAEEQISDDYAKDIPEIMDHDVPAEPKTSDDAETNQNIIEEQATTKIEKSNKKKVIKKASKAKESSTEETSYEEIKDLAKESQEEVPEQCEQTDIDNNEIKQLDTTTTKKITKKITKKALAAEKSIPAEETKDDTTA